MAISNATRNAHARGTKRVADSPADTGRKVKKVRTTTDENAGIKKPLFEDITSGSDDEYSGKLLTSTPNRVPQTPAPSPTSDGSGSQPVVDATLSPFSGIRMDSLINTSPVKRTVGGDGIRGTFPRPPTPMPRRSMSFPRPPTPMLRPIVTDPFADLPALEPAIPEETVPSPVATDQVEQENSGNKGLDTHARIYNTGISRRATTPSDKGKQVVGEIEPHFSTANRKTGLVSYTPLNGGGVVAEDTKSWGAELGPSKSNNLQAAAKNLEEPLQDYIPSLEEFVNPGNVTSPCMRRIVTLALRDNPIAYRFKMSGLPVSAKWGTTTSEGDDNSKYLCINNHPIRTTIVGKVTSAFFFTPEGQPVARANIGISPLRKADLEAYNALANTKAKPVLNEVRDIVYAGRFQSERKRNQAAQECLPYRRVFDMRSGPTTKRFPQSAAMIAEGDIVMLECTIYRFRPTNGSARRSSRAWDNWIVRLELQDIIYLFQKPDDGDGSDVEVFIPDGEEY